MEWVASTLHTTSEHGISSITTADAHTSAASSRLNWRPLRFKWTRPFRIKTKFGFCACAVIFQLASDNKLGKLASYYIVWETRTLKYANPVCINTSILLRTNELDFTARVVKVALSSCFQSNEILLTCNYNNLSVCEPWYDTRQAPPVR